MVGWTGTVGGAEGPAGGCFDLARILNPEESVGVEAVGAEGVTLDLVDLARMLNEGAEVGALEFGGTGVALDLASMLSSGVDGAGVVVWLGAGFV